MSIVQNLLHWQSSESASNPVAPFESLVAEGRSRGLEPRPLARAVELGDSSLRKLDRRLIIQASIPPVLIDCLARVLQLDLPTITAYLQQGPTLGAATEHRSEQAPKLLELEDFFDAVRADPTISCEHAERWFELERSIGSR